MIKIGNEIPNIKIFDKHGSTITWTDTHTLFANKKILLIGLPGLFLIEYAATQMISYDLLFDDIKQLGIDEIYFTSVDDYYVQRAYSKDQELQNVKHFADPSGRWCEAIGMLEDMEHEGLGNRRSHRYAMIIDNCICKTVKYEDFSQNPVTGCFNITDVDSILTYLQSIQTTWEKWNDNARDKVDANAKER